MVKALWDSWDPDAFLRDKESGLYFDVDKMHRLDHRGEFFSVRRPLNADRPIQGHPVIAQAGASPTGLAFAARVADMVFMVGLDLVKGRESYLNVKQRVEAAGRNPDEVFAPTGINAILGRTQEEAQQRFDEMTKLADGFNIGFGDTPVSLEIFVDHVVPELQRRGIFHSDHRGRTLRDNLGLKPPATPHTSHIAQSK